MNASATFASGLPAHPVTGVRDAVRTGTRARWEAPASIGMLLLTGLLYVWNLAASGWANAFYSAAVQAGTQNWVAFFYGSSDAGNSITVDKPPASLWIMELSARLFGLSPWSVLIPQALMGVGTAAIVLFTVRRRFGAVAALLSAGIFALTPVAALMFRFNNPDALLLLLLTASVALTLRAIDSGRLRWLLLAGAAVGLGFLTKQLQAFLVLLLPVLAGVYFAFAAVSVGRRVLHLLAALGAVLASAGWWVAVVELVPASARPYIGGSQSNSFLELTFGYNGLGRLTGDETGSVTPGGGGGGGMWGETGPLRLFLGEIGGQISWLIPAALALSVTALVLIGRAPRRDPRRILLISFAGWLVVTMVAFSYMAGIFHTYYTVALSAPLAGLLGASAFVAFAHRDRIWVRIVLAATAVATAGWAWTLLERASSWLPWLKVVVLAVSLAGAVLVLLPPRSRLLTATTASVLAVGALLAPAAYTVQTVTTAHSGSIVTAGPAVTGGMGGPGGGFGGHGGGFPGGGAGEGFPGGGPGAGTTDGPSGGPGAGAAQGGQGGPSGGMPSMLGGSERGSFGGAGGAGGLLEASTVGAELKSLLEADASAHTWVAATIGSQSAAGYQLSTGDAVMPIGGFNGSDPSPTLAQFQAYVQEGRIHYFLGGGGMGGGNGGSRSGSEIQQWVEDNFTAKTIDGVTVYDLTAQN